MTETYGLKHYRCDYFEIIPHQDDDKPNVKYYSYKIHLEPIIESPEMFETYWEACFAAIGHIETMKRENKDDC